MKTDATDFELIQHGKLWIAIVPTQYGLMEFLCGEGSTPDQKLLNYLRAFLSSGDPIREIRKSVFTIPVLWRPIRFAVNGQGRMGLQFAHRITGKQDGMHFADEHSSFKLLMDTST